MKFWITLSNLGFNLTLVWNYLIISQKSLAQYYFSKIGIIVLLDKKINVILCNIILLLF